MGYITKFKTFFVDNINNIIEWAFLNTSHFNNWNN